MLPDADPTRSLNILRARCLATKGHDWSRGGHDYLADWVASEQNHDLADFVVYSDGLTPEQYSEKIHFRIRHVPRRPFWAQTNRKAVGVRRRGRARLFGRWFLLLGSGLVQAARMVVWLGGSLIMMVPLGRVKVAWPVSVSRWIRQLYRCTRW